MLKCPNCGRSGGPFRLRAQARCDGQDLAAWGCACGNVFHAPLGAEKALSVHSAYQGFSVDHQGRSYPVALKGLRKAESVWQVGWYTLTVAGQPATPRTVTIAAQDDPARVVSRRIAAGASLPDLVRLLRMKGPLEYDEELMGKVLYRIFK